MSFSQEPLRLLPVFLLLDTSGTMNGEIDGGRTKIQELNRCVYAMLQSFVGENSPCDIQCCIITFGGTSATLQTPLKPAASLVDSWTDITAGTGMTPMGDAFRMIKEIVDDRNNLPDNAYRPLIVLVSDGQPNDRGWEEQRDRLIQSGPSSKCDRMVLGIGDDVDAAMMLSFAKSSEKFFTAEQAKDMVKFFQIVSMTIIKRSISEFPNDDVFDLEQLVIEAESSESDFSKFGIIEH